MTIIPHKNMGEVKILEVEASSVFGSGLFCITNQAIIYEVEGRGIYLNFIPSHMLKKYNVWGSGIFSTKKFRIVWSEKGEEHFFEFRTKHHKRLEEALKKLVSIV